LDPCENSGISLDPTKDLNTSQIILLLGLWDCTRSLGLHKMGSSVISSMVEPLTELKSSETYIYIMLLNVLTYVKDWV